MMFVHFQKNYKIMKAELNLQINYLYFSPSSLSLVSSNSESKNIEEIKERGSNENFQNQIFSQTYIKFGIIVIVSISYKNIHIRGVGWEKTRFKTSTFAMCI